MNNHNGLTLLRILVGLVVASSIAAGTVAVLRMDLWGDRTSHQAAAEETAPEIDASLIHYRQTGQFAVGLREARALAVGPDGWICVGGDRAVNVLSPDGSRAYGIAVGGSPQCLAIADNLYVGMEDRVEVYDAKGKRLAAWKPLGGEAAITGLVAAENDVFVADAGNQIVWHFDTSGKLKGRIGEPNKARNYPGFLITNHYFPLTIGGDGLLHVVNPRALRVEAFTFGGDLEYSWGKGSPGVEGFFGCCNPAYLATLADRRFVTMEKGSRVAKLFSQRGKFECVVAGPDQIATIGPIAADRHGRILILDPTTATVRIYEAKKPTAGASQ
jgi:hypothetical protein